MQAEFEFPPEVLEKLELLAGRFSGQKPDLNEQDISPGKVETVYRSSPSIRPSDFLAQKDWVPEIAALTETPDIGFMQGLLRHPNQNALVLFRENWYVARGEEDKIPEWLFPKGSDIRIHTHISGSEVDFLPVFSDFISAPYSAKNYIISTHGITQFWRFDTDDVCKTIMNGDFTKSRKPANYINLLQKLGAEFEVEPWRHLTNDRVEEMLSISV